MSYNYATERDRLFTDEGQKFFLKVRDTAQRLLSKAGAFRFDALCREYEGGYESWMMIAAVDRMIELGELEECPRASWQQYKVYSTTQRLNL